MKRNDFKAIIKLRSVWKIDRRKGDYKLPNGGYLSNYIENLVRSQMQLDSLFIRKNGDLCVGCGGTWNEETKNFDDCSLMPAFKNNETCTYEEQERRITSLVFEIIK